MSPHSSHARPRLLVRAGAPVVALLGCALTAGSAAALVPSAGTAPRTAAATTATTPTTTTTTTTRTVTLKPTADTFVSMGAPTVSQGRQQTMTATRTENRAFLKFDTGTALADTEKVTAGRLEVYVTNADTRTRGVRAHRTTNSWTEDGLLLGNRPAFDTRAVTGDVPVNATAHWQQVPLTVLSGISTTAQTGFEVLNPTAYSVVRMATRESTQPPRLVLTVQKTVTAAVTTATPTTATPTTATPTTTAATASPTTTKALTASAT